MAKLGGASQTTARAGSMIVDPFRLYRRHRRLSRDAREEAQFLRRRYGDEALRALRERLARPDLTRWGRRVLERSARLIEKRLVD